MVPAITTITKKGTSVITNTDAAMVTIAMNKAEKLWILFRTTFLISMTANTGYAILSVMKADFVRKYRWVSEEEMADYIALAQSVPGPMAINASMIIGRHAAGFAGSLAAVLGCALPPFLVMLPVTFFYDLIIDNAYVSAFMKGMQYGVAAMLLDVLIGLFVNVTKKDKIYPLCLILAAFLYIRFIRESVFYLALFCIAAALLKTLLIKREVRDKTC